MCPLKNNSDGLFIAGFFGYLVWQEGIEPTTYGLEGRCSIRLSYCHRFTTELQ